jgi:hypothetical protein
MATVMKCPNCTAPVQADPSAPTFRCEYCGFVSRQTVAMPSLKKQIAAQLREAQQEAARQDSSRRAEEVERAVLVARRTGSRLRLVLVLAGLLPVLLGIVIPLVATRSRRSTLLDRVAEQIGSRMKAARTRLTPGALPPEPEDLASTLRKVRAHALCGYTFFQAVADTESRYFGWVKSRTKGPTCKEPLVTWGLFHLKDTAECRKGLEAVRGATPRLVDLEQRGAAFVAALEALVAVNNEGFAYYEAKEYIEDDCAKGIALHPKLLSAFAAVDAARPAFAEALAREERALLEKRLTWSSGAEPDSVRHRLLELQKEAAALVEDDHDVERMKAARTSFKAALSAFTRAGAQKSGTVWVKNAAQELGDAARELLHRRITRKKADSFERSLRQSSWNARSINGSSEKLQHAYRAFLLAVYELQL